MGTAGVACTKHRITELHGRKTESWFLRFASVALIVLQLALSALKRCKLCWYVKFPQWKGQFWIQEVIRARLDTCLRLSSIDEVVSRHCKLRKQVNKIRLLKVLFVKKLL